jgi:hypothetical protein
MNIAQVLNTLVHQSVQVLPHPSQLVSLFKEHCYPAVANKSTKAQARSVIICSAVAL